MNEMLGNHYFMLRDYKRALPIFEEALSVNPNQLGMMRKLVICYSQVGMVAAATNVFLSLIKKDIDFVIQTDPVEDDCPCPHLIYEMEKNAQNNMNSTDFKTILAMYWLYCDPNESLNLFTELVENEDVYPAVKPAYLLIKTHLKNKINHQTERRNV